jgi:hypothetical protein
MTVYSALPESAFMWDSGWLQTEGLKQQASITRVESITTVDRIRDRIRG